MRATMAEPRKKRKPGPGRPKGPTPPKELIAAFRGTTAFLEWFVGLVEHCRKVSGWRSITKTDVIVKALTTYAKEVGYEPEAPNGSES